MSDEAMQCCPLSSADDCEIVQACSQSVRKARKETKCYECHEVIPAGTKYEYTKGIFEREWFKHKTCMVCREIRDHFACNGYIFGMLWEDLENNFFPDMPAGGPCMQGLSPEAKAKLFERRLKWLEDTAT